MNELKDHQLRVVFEKEELDEKIEKLGAFQETKVFNDLEIEEKMLLIEQFEYMKAYSDVLERRISYFKGE